MASFYGNCEIDVAIEDERFARMMEAQYETDLGGAAEVALAARRLKRPRREGVRARGSAGRAAAGAAQIAKNVGAAIVDARILTSAERTLLLGAAVVLGTLAVLAFRFPRLAAWPLALVAAWLAIVLLFRAVSSARSG